MADWAADWHFCVATGFLLSFSSYFKVWNIILFLHGMDVDLKSNLVAANFLPSKVDLITVRESFLSAASFVTKSEDKYHK